MQKAKRGEPLDFSTVTPIDPRKARLRLDAIRLKDLRKRLSERAKAYSSLRRTETPQMDLVENLGVWDSDRGEQFPSGPCSINLGELIPRE